MFLHRFRLRFRHCVHYLKSVEEYAYVFMQECYDQFVAAWKTATDLSALSTIHGAYVAELARVLFMNPKDLSLLSTLIVSFIRNAITKMSAFIDFLAQADADALCGRATEAFLRKAREMEHYVAQELDNYTEYYKQFMTQIGTMEHRLSRFLLRRLNPEAAADARPAAPALDIDN